jgi:hypothetical protein
MAKKAKKVKAKKAKLSFKKVDAGHYRSILSTLKSGKKPETSGELIRARLVEGKMDADGRCSPRCARNH